MCFLFVIIFKQIYQGIYRYEQDILDDYENIPINEVKTSHTIPREDLAYYSDNKFIVYAINAAGEGEPAEAEGSCERPDTTGKNSSPHPLHR